MSNSAAVAAVKRAMVKECAKQGITDYTDICDTCLDAVDGIGPQTLPGLKAHDTMRRENRISCRRR